MTPSTTAYGLILAVDGYGASADRCADEAGLLALLQSLPREITMRPLGEPHIVRVDEPGIAGLSGFTFIMESHISIHTYSERGFVTADIYSCKPFDTETAAKHIADAFKLVRYETQMLVRGRGFHDLPYSPVPPHMRR